MTAVFGLGIVLLVLLVAEELYRGSEVKLEEIKNQLDADVINDGKELKKLESKYPKLYSLIK